MRPRTEEYRSVIASKRWRELRVRLMRERGSICERCGKTWAPGYKVSLQLHHKTYERLGRERDEDVQLVCESCHSGADVERVADSRRRSDGALYDARLDGWASRRHGERWASEATFGEREAIADEFEQWLETHHDGEGF